MKFYIETEISEGKIIHQLGSTNADGSHTSKTIEWVYDTKEHEIMEALIKLGWKPPKIEPATLKRAEDQALERKEYANLNGKFCPYCRSKHFVSLGPVDVGNNGTGYQHMACKVCRKKWYNQYELVGFVPDKE